MRRIVLTIAAAVLALGLPRAAAAIDGALDGTFAAGSGVERVESLAGQTRYASYVNSMAVQDDGRILLGIQLAGYVNAYVERVLADGSGPDTSVNGSGKFVLPTYGAVSQPHVKLDAARNIVIGGNCPDTGQGGYPCLWRLGAGGSADTSFGTGGWVELPATTINVTVYSKIVDFDFASDGSIYVLVAALYDQLPYANPTMGILFKLDGSGNVVGASNGAAIGAPAGTTQGDLRRIIVRGGKLTLGGTVLITNAGPGYDFVVMRFDTNGSADSAFGSNGVATFGFDIGGSNQDDLSAMLIQPDGKIVLGGTATDGAQTPQVRMALARLLADGSALDGGDPGFGGPGGKFTFTADYNSGNGDRSQDTLTDLAWQSDYKILTVGWSDRSNVIGADPNADNLSSAVFRFDAYGVADPAFAGGTLNLALGFMSDATRVDHANAVALQSGRIVLGGYAGAGGGSSDFDAVVGRLQNDLIFANGFDLAPPPTVF